MINPEIFENLYTSIEQRAIERSAFSVDSYKSGYLKGLLESIEFALDLTEEQKAKFETFIIRHTGE